MPPYHQPLQYINNYGYVDLDKAYDLFNKLIEKFYTECQALMLETCGQNRALAGKLAERDLLRDKDKQNNERTFLILFGDKDPRAEKARL